MRHRSSPIRLFEKMTAFSAGALLLTWAGIAFCFAVIYVLLTTFSAGNGVMGLEGTTGWERFWSSLYFSIITTTTVGYGDLAPAGFSRLFASIQSVFGFLVFAIFVTKLVSAKQEFALENVHKLTFEDVFYHTREGFYIMRQDCNRVIGEVQETQKLSLRTWEILTIAYQEGQSLFQQIPDFYDADHQLYTIDAKREQLLIEAVQRTLVRIEEMLDVLDKKRMDWRGHAASFAELTEMMHIAESTVMHWLKESPYAEATQFQGILRSIQEIRLRMNSTTV